MHSICLNLYAGFALYLTCDGQRPEKLLGLDLHKVF